MRAFAVAYEPLHLHTFVFLCLGFAGQPAARALQARSRARQTRMLVAELESIWAAATTVRPGIRQVEHAAVPNDELETLLYRQVLGIRDAMIDTRVSFEVSDQEREVIERAERHLLGARPTELAAATSPAASAKGLQQR